jgi:coproporphyrinogen III oxidase-like Fe-S oxidoreductase
MNNYNIDLIYQYEKDSDSLIQKRLNILKEMKLSDILEGKNPYLFPI